MKKIRGIDNRILITFTVLFFTVVYAVRMFVNHPWYDELYTYYSFISKGPLYAAIHWPLPNNHVGYSVLSACFGFLGSSTIALRGVSALAAVANIYLIYRLGIRFFERYACVAPIVYATTWLVHNISIQGRGYTLATTCYLAAVLSLCRICDMKKCPKKYYWMFAASLCLAAYILPSSAFFIVPVCLAGGLYLLLNREFKTFWKLVIAGAVAGIIALGLYTVIWLAIGSNLLSKTEGSGYTGIYQIDIILRAPFKAIGTGIDYMLASPYIQSMERKDVIKGLYEYLSTLFGQYFSGLGGVIVAFLTVVGVWCVIRVIMRKDRFLELFLAVSIFALPIMLIVQAQQPYYRVFSYFAVVMALSVGLILNIFNVPKIIPNILAVFLLILIFLPSYNLPLGERENQIKDMLSVMEDRGELPASDKSVHYVDDYQKYVLKFYYDAEPCEKPLGEADYVIVPDELNGVWPNLYDGDNFDFDVLNKNYTIIDSVEGYTAYKLNE